MYVRQQGAGFHISRPLGYCKSILGKLSAEGD
jgi:hypothetical protein